MAARQTARTGFSLCAPQATATSAASSARTIRFIGRISMCLLAALAPLDLVFLPRVQAVFHQAVVVGLRPCAAVDFFVEPGAARQRGDAGEGTGRLGIR